MSATFCIAPYLPSRWAESDYSYTQRIGNFAIDVNQYRDQMKLRWVNVEIRTPENENYILEWSLPPSRPNFAGLWGRLSANRQVVIFGSGPKESFLDFILWRRNFVSSECDLYLFGSYYDTALLLRTDCSTKELVDYTGIVD
jgi:hypothetical protein